MAIKVNGKLVAGAGKSAYESAKDGGYTGTEDEFNTSLVNSVTVDGGGVMSMNESFGAAPFTLTFTEDGENDVSASEITYDNTESGMTATNVQDAITELSDSAKRRYRRSGRVYILAGGTDSAGGVLNLRRKRGKSYRVRGPVCGDWNHVWGGRWHYDLRSSELTSSVHSWCWVSGRIFCDVW